MLLSRKRKPPVRPGDCSEIYAPRELTLAGIHECLPSLQVAGTDGDGARIVVSDARDGVLLTLTETSLDADLEFQEHIEAASRLGRLPYVYDLDVAEGRGAAQEALAALSVIAARSGAAVASTRGVLMPDVGDPGWSPSTEPMVPTAVLGLRWYLRDSVCPDPAQAWDSAAGAVDPRLRAVRWMGEARMRDAGEGLALADARRRESPLGTYLETAWEPLSAVRIAPVEADDAGGLYVIEAKASDVELEDADDALMQQLLWTVAERLGAELAFAEVLGGYVERWYGASPVQVAGSEDFQSTRVGGELLAGLPPRPVPWLYAGPAWSEALAEPLADPRAPWHVERLERGTAVLLSADPVPSGEIDSWFPEDFRAGTATDRAGCPARRPVDSRP